MPNILKKIPNFKLPKFRMKDMGDLEELRSDYAEKNGDEIRRKLDGKKGERKLFAGTNYKTTREFFLRSTELYGDKTFVLETYNKKTGFEEISYRQFREDVRNFGTGLTKVLGLEGEKVMIIGETTYQWYVSYMALLCGAGIAVPTDKELPENELENIIMRSKAAAIICSPKKKDFVKKVALDCPWVQFIIEMRSEEPEKGKVVGFDFVKSEGAIFTDLGDNSLFEKEIDPEAFAVLIFTSGTTSAAKGVMICNRNLAANINGITPYVDLKPEDRLFSILPLHHTYESTIGFLYPMACGASIAICQGIKHIASDMKATQPTAIIAVPLLIEALHSKINKGIEKSGKGGMVRSMIRLTNGLRNVGIDVKHKVFKDIYENLGGRLRIVVSAAAPIDPKVGKWFDDIGVLFLQGYGLTETAPIAAVTPEFDTRIGSAGKVVRGDEIMILDPNERGEGEILIRGETVMLGYYQDEAATAEVLQDGWFHSGDVGYLDEDDFVYLTGRSKNVIVTQNGKNIYPEEIEMMLGKVEEIAECMVYGKEVEGEKELTITARVTPNREYIEANYKKESGGGAFADEELYKIIWEQIRLVNRKLPNYKCISRLEVKKDEFEKTTTMKIKRYAELKKEADIIDVSSKDVKAAKVEKVEGTKDAASAKKATSAEKKLTAKGAEKAARAESRESSERVKRAENAETEMSAEDEVPEDGEIAEE